MTHSFVEFTVWKQTVTFGGRFLLSLACCLNSGVRRNAGYK